MRRKVEASETDEGAEGTFSRSWGVEVRGRRGELALEARARGAQSRPVTVPASLSPLLARPALSSSLHCTAWQQRKPPAAPTTLRPAPSHPLLGGPLLDPPVYPGARPTNPPLRALARPRRLVLSPELGRPA